MALVQKRALEAAHGPLSPAWPLRGDTGSDTALPPTLLCCTRRARPPALRPSARPSALRETLHSRPASKSLHAPLHGVSRRWRVGGQNGLTPLCMAARSNKAEAARALVEGGADPRARL